MMKKILAGSLAGLLVGLLAGLVATSIHATSTTESIGCSNIPTYSITTMVVEVDYESDVVTVVDFNRNYWQFTGCEDWFKGDICTCTMNANGTEIIYDDEIINTRYCGWVEEWSEIGREEIGD